MAPRRVAVFCGSSRGFGPLHASAAVQLGKELAGRGIGLVYGGGAVGLMGVLADAVIGAGGEVTGVITESLLAREVAHPGIALRIVPTMHERKAIMADLADAFVMMPGGFGTLEEFLEAVTWTQLGVHAKPCGILDPGGYFEPLLALFDGAVREGFLKPEDRALVLDAVDPAVLLDEVARWQPGRVAKWIGPSER